MEFSLIIICLLSSFFVGIWGAMPAGKVYGVNLGSWLVLESWMMPEEWTAMGGQICDDCETCISSEYAFARAYPKTVDAQFEKHWDTWFTEGHVNELKAAGINTVRIPLGYWIIEALVDRPTESYPRGGLKYLRRGLQWLQAAGIQVILDHHAAPGVQSYKQLFTGNCTSDIQFFTPHNYHRALVWTAVMTTLAHLDPVFANVFAIEAVNEPVSDANQTPGYGQFQKDFVQTVREVEGLLGIPGFGNILSPVLGGNLTAALSKASSSQKEVRAALQDAAPILLDIGGMFALLPMLTALPRIFPGRQPLITNFMDVTWQYNNPPNPAAAANGPQINDRHVYFAFGGATDRSPNAYLASVCNSIAKDAGDSQDDLTWVGEWSLATEIDATDEFLRQFADAQKMLLSKGRGWIFWNFKTEKAVARGWSYLEGLRKGFFTQDPSQYNNPNICASYVTRDNGA
ncbi:glycoside hydrolase family 5 protein [Hygrophoropsis aurantiaca]|uniref:Glycoside hydrolase family 5 protein n=1 Tax=Hygrophoropsis aurantiaca TaxID=72124 RepID=A0ACB8A520_9AGAM|nr:glycoside hydrolase family 5 protein [Hygrophoropsis aurantiaca]